MKKYTAIILLLLAFTATSQEMWINELHYDNAGGDSGEFVEVVVEQTYSGDLANLEIFFYNGSNSNVYNSSHIKTLDTFDVGVSQGGFTIYSKLTPSMQNGSPDGIALVNNGAVVQFISYEGTITAAGGPAFGLTSTDIGVSESSATAIGESLQLSGTASHPEGFTWQAAATATMGQVNTGQTLVDEAPQVRSIFPADNSTAVGSSVSIQIEFSETVNADASSFAVSCGGSSHAVSLSEDSGLADYTLIPDTPWPASSLCQVTLIAANITDIGAQNQQLDGNGDLTAGDDFTSSFTVASDALPTVTSTTPAEAATLVPQVFTFDLNFSENVDLTANAVSLDCNGAVAISNGLPASNVSSLTLTPATSVALGTVCTVTLNAAEITDLDGDNDFLDGDLDGIAGGNYSFSFTIIEGISEIFELQGSGSATPFADDFVRLSDNVVTAVADTGFFIQTPTERDDGNINTSNGLFVFTGSGTKVFASVGDWVDVRGQIVEFFDFTELTSVSYVTVTSSNNPLPAAVEFDANVPSQNPLTPSCAIEFECYEGMLIHVANGIAISGSQAFGADINAEVEVTATGLKALREPGIEISQTGDSQLPPFPTATYDPDIFDENPEIFELDADALGLPSIEINGGATFSATGVLAYQFSDYELWPSQLTLTQKEIPVERNAYSSEISIATQNMERFFDDVDDPNINDFAEDSTSTATFQGRVAQASIYFRTLMKSPDIIVLTEVENLNAMQAIADKLNADDASLNYSAFLVEGNDFGGIDIGILSNQTVSNITITQLGANEILQFGNTNRKLHDRPPLWMNATVSKGSISQEVNILGVHMRSRSGITGSDRERVRNKHFEQSLSVAQMVQDIQSNASTVPLVVLGDFNDFEFSDGYADVIGEIQGVIDPVKNLLNSDGVTIINPVSPRLWNAVDTLPTDEKYSFVFRGTLQVLDHVLLSDAALAKLAETKFIRGNIDAPAKHAGDYGQAYRMSDHDGIRVTLELLDASDLIFRNTFE